MAMDQLSLDILSNFVEHVFVLSVANLRAYVFRHTRNQERTDISIGAEVVHPRWAAMSTLVNL